MFGILESQQDMQERKLTKRWAMLLSLLCVLLSVNPLHIAIIDVACFAVIAALLLLFPLSYSITLAGLIYVYGYSNIVLLLPGIVSLDTTLIKNYLCLALVLRFAVESLMTHRRIVFKKKMVVVLFCIAYCAIIRFMFLGLRAVVTFTCCALVTFLLVTESENPRTLKKFLMTLMIVEAGEILFGLINGNQISAFGWRQFQFCGVLDPNNCALHLNFLLSLLLLEQHFLTTKQKTIAKVIVGVFVIATISFSGICFYFCVLICDMLFGGKGRINNLAFVSRLLLLLGLLVVFVFLLNYADTLINQMLLSKATTIHALGERLFSMLKGLRGDNLNQVTSGRFDLGVQYRELLRSGTSMDILIGNPGRVNSLQSEIGSSHNAYLDYYGNYGIIGCVLLFLGILYNFTFLIRKKNKEAMCLFLLLFIVITSRTMGLESLIMFFILSRDFTGEKNECLS